MALTDANSKSNVNLGTEANFASGNPLKIIKDYQSTKSGNLVKIGAGHGSISYASNASTKDFVGIQDGEVARFNQIMNEPIENLMFGTH